MRRALPDDAQDLGALDPQAIQEETSNAWPRIRDADELHEALQVLGLLPEKHRSPVLNGPGPELLSYWFDGLVEAGRAYCATMPGGQRVWTATEALPLLLAAVPEIELQPNPQSKLVGDPLLTAENAILTILRGWSESSGPYTSWEMAETLGLKVEVVNYAISQMEYEGMILRGRY